MGLFDLSSYVLDMINIVIDCYLVIKDQSLKEVAKTGLLLI
jgi:hypothetical protein